MWERKICPISAYLKKTGLTLHSIYTIIYQDLNKEAKKNTLKIVLETCLIFSDHPQDLGKILVLIWHFPQPEDFPVLLSDHLNYIR